MDEAVRNGDGKTFVSVARVSISEGRLALHAEKVDLVRQRIDLDRKRLAWEINKHRRSVTAAKPPEKPKMTAEEKQRRIRQILGVE